MKKTLISVIAGLGFLAVMFGFQAIAENGSLDFFEGLMYISLLILAAYVGGTACSNALKEE